MCFLITCIFFLSLAASSCNDNRDDSSSISSSYESDPLPRLQTIVLEAYPWETLDRRCSIPCQSRLEAIGTLGLILFKFRNSSIRALGNILEVSFAKGNPHFNSIMNEPLLELFFLPITNGTSETCGRIRHLQMSVYEALMVRRSGSVKSLLYQLLSRRKPPICTSLQLAVKLALMKSIGKNVQQAIHQGRAPHRKNRSLTSESISQVLIVRELEKYIHSNVIKSFFQVANLTSFEYLYEYFGLVSDKTAKLLLEQTRPILTHMHLQFLSYLPLLSPKKKKMLARYTTAHSNLPSTRLLLLNNKCDRLRQSIGHIFMNLCPSLILTPIHFSSLDPPRNMIHVTILNDSKVEMFLPRQSPPVSILYHRHERNKFVSLTGMMDPEIGVADQDLIIVSMQPRNSLLLMAFMRRFFKERGVHDPLFMYFVHVHYLTVLLIQTNK